MLKSEIKKGLRVLFVGPLDGVAPLFEATGHKLDGKSGTITYGISEDIFCYPDDPASDMVWVAFEGDRMPRRQVSAAWLEPLLQNRANHEFMGLTYYFKIEAPAEKTPKQLEAFLRTLEPKARALGYKQTMVLNALFDSPERQDFARRLVTGFEVTDDRLKVATLRPNAPVWDHSPVHGSARLIPEVGVILVTVDERNQETVFGFFRYPEVLTDEQGNTVALTGLKGRWTFREFLKTPDPKIRSVVRGFADAGFLAEERDDFK